MAGRLLKVSSLATAVFASSGFYLYNRQLDLNDLSVIRFGRAAVAVSYCPQGLDLGIGDLMHLHSFCLDAFMFGLILRQLPVSWSKISGLASYLWPVLRFSGITRTGSVWTRVDHHGNLCLMLTCSGPGYLSFVFPTGSWQVQKWNQKGIKIDIFTDQ